MKKAAILFFILVSLLFSKPLYLEFSGNKSVDERSLFEAIGVRKPYFFEFWKKRPKLDPQKLPVLIPLIENYYKSHGYYHVRVKYTIVGDKIVVNIKENRPVTVADISYISKLDIRKLIPFEKGDVFVAEKFIQSKEKIKEYYADHHYCNVDLNAKAFVDIQKDLTYLVYDITSNEPCTFGTVSINAPSNIDKKIIRSLLHFKEGDVYSTEAIRRSYKEIYANEGVEKVVIDDTQRKGDSVPVTVSVSLFPKPVHFSIGAGYSSDEGLSVQMGVKHRNFPNNLKTIDINTRYSQIRRYIKSTYSMPISGHRRFATEIGYNDEVFDGYNERSTLVKSTLKQLFWPYIFQEGVIIDKTVTTDSVDVVNFPNGKLVITSITAAFDLDKRDSILDPTKGYRVTAKASGSVKSPLSDATYYKLYLTGVYHMPLGENTLSFRIRQGVIKSKQGHIPPSYRFYAGGMNSNRAFGYRQLGPKNSLGNPIGVFSLTEATVEYRFDIAKKFRGVIFSDITYVGKKSIPDYRKVYTSIGPGIRYMTPVGPIAFDLGFNAQDFSSYTLHFHVGELF